MNVNALTTPAVRRKRVRTPELDARILATYESGMTIRQAAETYDISYCTAYSILQERGVLRRRGQGRVKRVRTPELDARILATYESGKTIQQAAETYSISYGTARSILQERDVLRRPGQGRVR